jgi:two-component system NarL family response regulator
MAQIMSRRPIRVLVADDHPVVLEGLVRLLSSAHDIEIAATASSGAEAVAMFREHRPDVAILDLRMPGMSGMEALREIRRSQPGARVLILTTFDAEEDVYNAIQAGARGYILKEASGREIIGAVVSIHDGQRYIPESISMRLAERIGQSALTPREIEVLTLASRGEKNKEIGAQLGITEGTVKGYINNILLKLQARDRTEAVAIAIRRGIIPIDGA